MALLIVPSLQTAPVLWPVAIGGETATVLRGRRQVAAPGEGVGERGSRVALRFIWPCARTGNWFVRGSPEGPARKGEGLTLTGSGGRPFDVTGVKVAVGSGATVGAGGEVGTATTGAATGAGASLAAQPAINSKPNAAKRFMNAIVTQRHELF